MYAHYYRLGILFHFFKVFLVLSQYISDERQTQKKID